MYSGGAEPGAYRPHARSLRPIVGDDGIPIGTRDAVLPSGPVRVGRRGERGQT
jgi:hypothetical protein